MLRVRRIGKHTQAYRVAHDQAPRHKSVKLALSMITPG